MSINLPGIGDTIEQFSYAIMPDVENGEVTLKFVFPRETNELCCESMTFRLSEDDNYRLPSICKILSSICYDAWLTSKFSLTIKQSRNYPEHLEIYYKTENYLFAGHKILR